MKQLYLARHGESEHNKARRWSGRSDTPLTAKGHRQAKQTGRQVKQRGLAFDIIISSPLQRAQRTARHIATHIGYPKDKIVLHPGFIERDFGKLEGRRGRLARVKYVVRGEAALDNYQGVETLAEMQQRAEDMLAYLHTLPYERILVVAHGSFGRALRRAINQEPLDKRGESLHNAQIIRLI